MADDINITVQCGRLTRDAVYKEVGGLSICNFSIAVNNTKKTAAGYTDAVSFFDWTIFGKIAAGLAPYLLKGKQINITGRAQQDKWVAQDGSTKYAIKFIGDKIQLLGGINHKVVEETFNETSAQFDEGNPF